MPEIISMNKDRKIQKTSQYRAKTYLIMLKLTKTRK